MENEAKPEEYEVPVEEEKIPKPVYYILNIFIALTFFGSFLSIAKGDFALGFVGLLFSSGLFWLLHKPEVLRREEVVERWGYLVEGAQGRVEEVFRDIGLFINETKATWIKARRRKVSPSIFKGMLGESRDFLVATDRSNPRLSAYKVYINVRDYGNNLDVSWYLTYKLGFLQSLLYSMTQSKFEPSLNLFEEQDLRAYVTLVHHSTLKALEKLMLSLDQDFSKVDRRSKGFLGVS